MSNRITDFALYVSIGVALVGLIVWGALSTQVPADVAIAKWGSFGAETLIVFGYLLRDFWSSRRRLSFWMLYGAALVVHTVGLLLLFSVVEHWRVMWWVPITVGEYLGIVLVFEHLGHQSRGKGFWE